MIKPSGMGPTETSDAQKIAGTYFKLKSLNVAHGLDELGGYCACQHMHFRTCSIEQSQLRYILDTTIFYMQISSEDE